MIFKISFGGENIYNNDATEMQPVLLSYVTE